MRNLRRICIALFGSISLLLVACANAQLPDGLYARLSTSKGEILIKLEYEKAPLTVCNFVGLAEGSLDASKGKKYFDGLVFHRVVKDFVIQTGDPNGDGTGGPGYRFPDEIAPDLKYDAEGVVGMANSGPNTNGSQFFISMNPIPQLNGGYAIFGKVTAGMDVVKKIAQGDKLNKVSIARSGAAAKTFKADQATWGSLVTAIKKKTEELRAADIAAFQKRWPGLSADSDGIYQSVIKGGSGPLPTRGQTASMKYKGMFVDGTIFDQSDLHGGVVDFQIGMGKLIPGWDKVAMQMRKGEKRMIVLPPELGYGARGTPGGPIPPNSFLAFELELVALK